MEPYRTIELSNGLQLELRDQSNRYFGDYHRIRIEVSCDIPLRSEFFGNRDDHPQLLQARRLYGDSLRFERSLERMGVAGADVERVREELVENFLNSSATYLEHAEFIARYVSRQLQKRSGGGITLPR
ncbi:MAG: hypothetical protein C0624_01065 [Desulfuromonas sp.]|nr:MAG: hypothetical protein C0624_01065 [Desulfuromonas sp.]